MRPVVSLRPSALDRVPCLTSVAGVDRAFTCCPRYRNQWMSVAALCLLYVSVICGLTPRYLINFKIV